MNRPTAFDGGPSPRIEDIPGPYWFPSTLKRGEVARLALGRQRAADAGHVEGRRVPSDIA